MDSMRMANRVPNTRPAWPDDADVAVSLTFDVDAETPVIGQHPDAPARLGRLSESRFGIARGLPRITKLLSDMGIRATFYVPGMTAELHPRAIEAIIDGGHEIGHHGYAHLSPQGLDVHAQRQEMERGLDALEKLGVRPIAYRAPSWELTRGTLGLLIEYGFACDSSLMEDDRPYRLSVEGANLVEMPVHWSLDDWPYFGWSPDDRVLLSPTASWKDDMLAEFTSARSERRHLTYTLHPEVIGRGYRHVALTQLLEEIVEQGSWFAPHGEVAQHLLDSGEDRLATVSIRP